jgi:hypothetical protein
MNSMGTPLLPLKTPHHHKNKKQKAKKKKKKKKKEKKNLVSCKRKTVKDCK